MSTACKGEARETHEGYNQVFGYVCVVRGVQKQFGNPTAKYVKVCEVERVDRSKLDRLFGFNYLLSA
jgi:hypothetical protein